MMGNLLNASGISRRIMNFAHTVTAHLTGGLAQVNVVLSMLLAGMSGSANGDAAMQSRMLVPEMVKRGYSKEFSASVTASSSLISPMIPPGIGLIVYGFVADVSIGDLFMGGILPGILMAIALMVVVYLVSKRRGYGKDSERKSFFQILKAFFTSLPSLMLIVIIIGGIRFGVFTPSEAGALACVYAFVLGLIYREFTLKSLWESIKMTIEQSAGIMLILAASSAFSYILTIEQLPQTIASALLTITTQPQLMLLLMFAFFVIAGMFLEGTSGIVILGPLLTPVAMSLGINPVHFGILLVYSMHLGGITPPVGTIMYLVSSITRIRIWDFIKESLPFYLALLLFALLLIFIPQITLLLVN
jgi:tripartite ATP-independent transporter DctM subunit